MESDIRNGIGARQVNTKHALTPYIMRVFIQKVSRIYSSNLLSPFTCEKGV